MRYRKAVGASGRSAGRNERIVVPAERDWKRHGRQMNQHHRGACKRRRNEMSGAGHGRGPAR